MAFTSTIIAKAVIGNKRMVMGKYVNTGGSTGGDCTTGLKRVETFQLCPAAAAVIATQSVANETFPLGARTPVTIVTSANETGQWLAIGF